MKVHICYTYNDEHKRIIVKVFEDFKQAKEWLHSRTKKIRVLIRMYCRYQLANKKKDKDKLYTRYYKYRIKHGLYDTEEMHSPFFNTWDVEKK